jgi:hypothetical protein
MLKQIAQKAAHNLVAEGETKEFALDPSTLFTFIELLRGVVELWQSCNKSSTDAYKSAKTPSLRDKLALKMFVRRELGGRQQFRQHNGDKIVSALLKTGNNISQDEVEKVFAEV